MKSSFFLFSEQNTFKNLEIELDPNFRIINSDKNTFSKTNKQSFVSALPIIEQQFSVTCQRSSPISTLSQKIEDSPINQLPITLQQNPNSNPNSKAHKKINNINTTKPRRSTRSSTRRSQIHTRSTTRNQKNNNIQENLSGIEPTKKIKKLQSGKIVQSEQDKQLLMSRNKTTLTKEAIQHRQELLKIQSVSQVRKMDQEEKRLRRLEKNRVSARKARERKKAHWSNLETNNKHLKKQNSKLKKQISEKEKKIKDVNQRFELLEKEMSKQQQQIKQLLQLLQQQSLHKKQEQQLLQQQQEEEQQKQLQQIDQQQQRQQQDQELFKQEEESFQFDSWLKDMISIPDQKLNSYFSPNPNEYGLLFDGDDTYFFDDLDQSSEQTTTTTTRKRGLETFGLSLFVIFIVFGLFLNFSDRDLNKNANVNNNSNNLESKRLCSLGNYKISSTKDSKSIKEGEKIGTLIKKEILDIKKKMENHDSDQHQIKINSSPNFGEIYHQNQKLNEDFYHEHSHNTPDTFETKLIPTKEEDDGDDDVLYSFNFDGE
ncbi:transcription factor hy5-like [Anaeramoeba flamelloides]|uniref:Transcription factor hy5-like n=1 Tax=Anaeramoeba flamelloides TaxID=1746091 RepID=A0ABQ8YQ81_9EUKA|nr:transcription factor hy5-like [Anaeramoeba flamelloides]